MTKLTLATLTAISINFLILIVKVMPQLNNLIRDQYTTPTRNRKCNSYRQRFAHVTLPYALELVPIGEESVRVITSTVDWYC